MSRSAFTNPAVTKPFPKAVAIRPAPKKPIENCVIKKCLAASHFGEHWKNGSHRSIPRLSLGSKPRSAQHPKDPRQAFMLAFATLAMELGCFAELEKKTARSHREIYKKPSETVFPRA